MKRDKRRKQEQLEAINNNEKAKNQLLWSKHDIKPWTPRNKNQHEVVNNFNDGFNPCLSGCAGVGKSYIALALALTEIFDELTPCTMIRIVRSCVATRNPGHLPGTAEEKAAPYEAPYNDIVGDICGYPMAYTELKSLGRIIFQPTAFLRSCTWNDTVIVIDEAQNMTFEELESVLTRAGKNSRIILCGSIRQIDLNERKEESGFDTWLKVLDSAKSFKTTNFIVADIVRSDLCGEIMVAVESFADLDASEKYMNLVDVPLQDLKDTRDSAFALSNMHNGQTIMMPYESYNDVIFVMEEIARRNRAKEDDNKNVVSLVTEVKPSE